MKALFIIFHGFEEFNGISKKIRYQVHALKQCKVDIQTCYLTDDNNHKRRMIDNQILRDYGSGIKGKILKRIEYRSIINYVETQQIKFVYIRYAHNASPFTIYLMYKIKKAGTKIILEIPTYPYDEEYKGLPFSYQCILFFDKIYRKKLMKYVDKIVTFSDYKTIWGKPTIRISNGIDFDQIELKKTVNDTSKELHLIGVATMHPWHGFDRAIAGLALYYNTPKNLKVYFHIVGYGIAEALDLYKKDVIEHHLECYVTFHGALFGSDLNEIFEKTDIGIGSLARHRSNIDKIKTLKNREYAARGIPFVYSETDDDFEQMPYILKIPADETPLDIERIVKFYRSIKVTPAQIRESIIHNLSWKSQMQIVLNQTFNLEKNE